MLFPLYAVTGLFVGTIGAVPYVMVKAFPPVVRFSGLSFSYNGVRDLRRSDADGRDLHAQEQSDGAGVVRRDPLRHRHGHRCVLAEPKALIIADC